MIKSVCLFKFFLNSFVDKKELEPYQICLKKNYLNSFKKSTFQEFSFFIELLIKYDSVKYYLKRVNIRKID